MSTHTRAGFELQFHQGPPQGSMKLLSFEMAETSELCFCRDAPRHCYDAKAMQKECFERTYCLQVDWQGCFQGGGQYQ